MDLQLEGKRAFITGATAGIGYAIAEQLLKEGVKVIINGRSEKSIHEAKTKLQKTVVGANVRGIVADFNNITSVSLLIDQLDDIDILINNVGVYRQGDFLKATDEDWQYQWDVNVMSGVRLSRALLPLMMRRGWGRIVFVSSECAALVPQDLIPYSVTKAAINALSRGLAQLTTGTDVTVNTVMPGTTLTDAAAQFLETTATQEGKSIETVKEEFFTQVRTTSIIQRFIAPEEIASTVTYYCSPLSSATNGAAIKLEGGSIPGIY